MESTRTTRQQLRKDWIEVRVRCGRCGRVLGRLYSDADEPIGHSDGRVQRMLARGARIDWFRHHNRCTADWPVRWDRLVPAYAKAAAPPAKRDRVIVLPFDL
jgi:hypothetical protein